MKKHTPRIIVPLSYAFLVALSGKLNAQSDVTQPGDSIIASSANSPGSEGVANAIDNQPTKYLNFDSANNGDSGFVVTPSVGVTRVIGMTIQSANDEPVRDPKVVRLEGSNDAAVTNFSSGTWEVIVDLTNIPPFTARFQTQTFFFDNFKAYKHYRWTVLETDTSNGCCMQVAEVELLGGALPPDVTQPGDLIIASSANSPGSEGVANAIDNQPTKYLNFDSANNGDSGFVVTPSIGASLVTGMTIQSANDEPVRDPKVVRLEGSNDLAVTNFISGTWEVIVDLTNIPPFTARFQTQTFLFDNFRPYKHYRWTVLETDTSNGCCMQVAEVELLGTGAPKDVTQPGDTIIASSANSPGSEGVANAIDNQPTKYLNFDSANNGDSGFVVTPAVGPTTVIGMTIQSANDEPVRDPKVVRLEGSNDTAITNFNSGNWELIVDLTDIPPFAARFQTQEFYFPNRKSYKHYRWTVLETDSSNGCCMQVAEVELLAATQSNPCGQARFLVQPVDTPVLDGSSATFVVNLNGPWTLQWLRNGQPIPGATALTYTTPPVTPPNDTNLYSCAIVGCETSQVVRATIFTPSATKSIGISFIGGGANGTPTAMLADDIAGIQLQAFWNNATNGTGMTGDGTALADSLVDSGNQSSTITVDFESTGTWGAGTGNATPLQRMLNGLIRTPPTPGTPGRITFGNVPAGNHAVIAYTVHIPLHFQNGNYWVTGQTSATNYIRVMNADEYNAAPGFYRGSSTSPSVRPLASYVRFDNVQPLGGAGGTIELGWDTATVGGGDRGAPVNAVQLVLNAPNPGAPPVISADPQPTVGLAASTVNLSVTVQGQNLTYQWLKNGRTLPNGGNVSGATTSTLTISNVGTNDVAIYSVAVFNPAGSAISRNASLRLSTFTIQEALVGYWKFDETSGATAANSASGASNGVVQGTAVWGAGQIGNALSFDGSSTYVFVTNYPKAQKQLGVSAWVKLDASTATPPVLIRNADGDLGLANPAEQFDFGFVSDATDGLLRLTAAIVVGPNFARVTDTTPFTLGTWQHVAFSADGAQIRLYRNGVEVDSTDYIQAINTPTIPWLSIGARLVDDTVGGTGLGLDPGNPANLVGQLDDLGLWTRGLSGDEAAKIFQAGQQHNALTSVVITPPPTNPEIGRVAISAGTITIQWSNGGTLESSPSLTSPSWTSTGNSTGTFSEAVSTSGNKFYRVKR